MTTLLLLAALSCPHATPAEPLRIRPTESSLLTEIGKSGEGRPLELLTLADPPDTAGERPAILIVAGLDGEDRFSTTLAESIARRLESDHPELLRETTFYILPLANPDGAGRPGRHGTARVIDQDRDGASDEDPPRDLDGNGVITMMRRANPPLDDPPTHLVDPAEPRLMKTPDHARGERATHSLHVEGLDSDGDGLIGEDGIDGVDLDRNFMHRWPEHAIDSGPFQLSEPEARAIADFVITHPNITMAVIYGRHDTLINLPDAKSMDITGKTPKELAGEDLPGHEQVADLYRELVGQEHASTRDSAGSLHAWLYGQRGIPTFASTGWGRPAPSADIAEEEAPGEEPSDEPKLEPSDQDAAGWLTYSDQARDGAGFIEWTPFEHPQLGPVEIGGWVPGFRSTPPEAEVPGLAERHAGWITELAARGPRLEVIGPEVEALGGGLIRIRIGLRNTGSMPTRNHQATRVRVQRPTNLRLHATDRQLIDGRQLVQVDSIRPGELVVREWTLRPDAGKQRIEIEVDDPVLAMNIRRTVEVSP